MDMMKRVPVRELDPKERSKNFEEVCLGYTEEEAQLEASRCLNCKNPRCVMGCPVSINIPGFISEVKEGNYEKAYKIITSTSSLPAVCGRVCPQEKQCEGHCVRGIKGESISIGNLERFVADWAREHQIKSQPSPERKGKKVAIVGSGPAGLACAGDLAKWGYDVTIFESTDVIGGVLTFGIPEFRLPKEKVVVPEVENVKALGVDIRTGVTIGRDITIDDLMEKEGYGAVFVGCGANVPKMMGIQGEDAKGVFAAGTFLKKYNLGDKSTKTTPPDLTGKVVVIVGGGNVAMDAARTSVRFGADVRVVYRRGEEELPAFKGEIQEAKEEGISFHLLTNPTEIMVDEDNNVKGVKLIDMELGEPDDSGRRRPIPVEGSEHVMDADLVIMALGTVANPLIPHTTEGLDSNKYECIVTDVETGATTKPGVFAGGDDVTGPATVILAMGAGRRAAKSIDEYLNDQLSLK
ncbi:MAG: NADPH-dependent glutamate synthase [Lachnospiraceae bacterium]|nr:NADPH-dependent glutamate synthase [Lachnospiraceae bacterium]